MLEKLVLIPVLQLTRVQLAMELTLRLMRSRGLNRKTGGATYNWSIPPGKTCRGITKICWKKCYARRLQARRPNVAKAWQRCYELTQHPLFGAVLSEVLARLPPGLFRLHVSGDFYAAWYFTVWHHALRANPHLKPFAFTRSWRDASIKRAFARAGWPHWLMASTDHETGPAPRQMREARMGDIRVRDVRAGKVEAPASMCLEQRDGVTTCDHCGACPAAKWGTGKFVDIKKPEPLITFAMH